MLTGAFLSDRSVYRTAVGHRATLGRPATAGPEMRQVDRGKGGQDDHDHPVHRARGDKVAALHHSHTGSNGRDPQPEVRDREEHGEHPGSLVGVSKRGDQPDAALEAGAEADPRDGGSNEEPRQEVNPEGRAARWRRRR